MFLKAILSIAALLHIFAPCSTVFGMRSEEEYTTHFDHFRMTYDKSYEDFEEPFRYLIFKENFDRIHQHNSKGLSWTMELNEFADLTWHEFRDHYLGLNRVSGKTNISTNNSSHAIPDSIDWVAKGAVTGVKNQQQCGSCWAFSTTGSVESAWFLKTGHLISLSEQQLIDCSTAEGDQGCNGGLMDNAFKYIIESGGICTEDSYPYTAADGTCKTCTNVVKISSYVDVPVNNEDALRQAVSQQPVSIALEADQSGWQFYNSGVYTGDCGTTLDHGVLLVGYGTDNGTDFWKIKNSWGPGWGEQGYIRLKRGSGSGNPGMCGLAMSASYPVVAPSLESSMDVEVPFKSCGSTTDIGSVYSVTAGVWPPAPGHDLTVAVVGAVKQKVNNGNYTLDASWDGISIWDKYGKLVDFGISTPIAKGIFRGEYTQHLPGEIPRGTIVLTISSISDTGTPIFCVQVSADM